MPSDRPERAPGSPTHAPVVLAALLLTCAAAAEPAPSIVPEPTVSSDVEPAASGAAARAVSSEAEPAVSSDSARAEIERLRALGYLEFAEDESADELSRKGVTRRDPQRSQPGYNLYNEQHTAAAVLMDAAGRVVHRFEDPAGKYWARVELLPDGDLIAVGAIDRGQRRTEIVESDRYVMRLGWNGELRWKREIGAHHDVEPLADGSLYVLTMSLRRVKQFRKESESGAGRATEVRDDWIVQLDSGGEIVAKHSLLELFRAGPFPFTFTDVAAHLEVASREGVERGGLPRVARASIDLLHSNSIERFDQPQLEGSTPLHQRDTLLVTSRHQDVVAAVSVESDELRWAWGRGELSGPHDATWLANGNVLIFDNGLGRSWSRVVEVDPTTDRIVWEYGHPSSARFYTASRGSAQRLANGNTLITNSGAGQAFEVTRDGSVVWEFWNPSVGAAGKRATLGRLRRLDVEFIDGLLARFGRDAS